MTNLSAGVKRSWEEKDTVGHKRSKERDWKDVHLKSGPSGRQLPHSPSSKSRGRNGVGYGKRHEDRERERDRPRERRRSRERRHTPPPPPPLNRPKNDDDEREEGECVSSLYIAFPIAYHRIHTRIPASPPPETAVAVPTPIPAPEPLVELDISPEIEVKVDPETARLKRLEKWKAIRARAGTANASPAPDNTISAVLPPPSSSSPSDPPPLSTSDTPLPTSGFATRTSPRGRCALADFELQGRCRLLLHQMATSYWPKVTMKTTVRRRKRPRYLRGTMIPVWIVGKTNNDAFMPTMSR